MSSVEKVMSSGRVVAVQPRIWLTRSFDERSHSYLGYVLRIDGACGGEAGEFVIAVGEAAHRKHRVKVGMELSGCSVPVEHPDELICETLAIEREIAKGLEKLLKEIEQ